MTYNTAPSIASIRQKLLNLSKARNQDFQYTLTRYGIERILYRISKSPYKDQFILKGAQLFLIWTEKRFRQTRDLDLLGFGDSSTEHLTKIFRVICNIAVESDGLVFDPDTLSISDIRDDHVYGGQRLQMIAYLGKAKIPLQIDIGFGDVITPNPLLKTFPSLLGLPEPQILTYTLETVIAEKVQAMVILGIVNSRMKDFYDIHLISSEFNITGKILVQALQRTFLNRNTDIPAEVPSFLTSEFYTESQKLTQWNAFLRKNNFSAATFALKDLLVELKAFIHEPLCAASSDALFNKVWEPPGPWK